MLALRSSLEGANDEDQELFAKGEDFMVMVLNGHFEIDAGKLGNWLATYNGYMESTLVYFCHMSLCV